jgi:hypothetical protein
MNDLLLVRPALSADRAAEKLKLRRLTPPFNKIRMEKTELVFLPHYLFTIRLTRQGQEEAVDAAVDAVSGHFAHWRPEGILMENAEGQEFEIPFLLSAPEAREKLLEQYRWVRIAAALRTRKFFAVIEAAAGPRLYYPFWAGYYRSRGRWRFEVCDAVSGMRQGGKVREALLLAWTRK